LQEGFALSKILFYFSVSIEQINLPEISLSYLKSRWLKESISFELYCVDAMFIAMGNTHYITKNFYNTSEVSVPIFY